MDKTTPTGGLTTINTTVNNSLGRFLPKGIPMGQRLGNAVHHPQTAYKEKQNESKTTSNHRESLHALCSGA
jgi:hypothetical protein